MNKDRVAHVVMADDSEYKKFYSSHAGRLELFFGTPQVMLVERAILAKMPLAYQSNINYNDLTKLLADDFDQVARTEEISAMLKKFFQPSLIKPSPLWMISGDAPSPVLPRSGTISGLKKFC